MGKNKRKRNNRNKHIVYSQQKNENSDSDIDEDSTYCSSQKMTHFKSQIGWHRFGISEKQIVPLLTQLKKREYDVAYQSIQTHPDIINKPDDKGWTPLMMMLANLKTQAGVDFVRDVLKFVDINRINLDDLNYLMIAIKYAEAEFLEELFQIFYIRQINIEYVNSHKMNAFDMCIDMYYLCNSCNCDSYYFNLAFSLRQKHGLKSIKYPKINEIQGMITPWILLNLEESDNYTIHYDEKTFHVPPYHNCPAGASNVEEDNVILYYEKKKGDVDKEGIEVFTSQTFEELRSGLEMLMVQNDTKPSDIQLSKQADKRNQQKGLSYNGPRPTASNSIDELFQKHGLQTKKITPDFSYSDMVQKPPSDPFNDINPFIDILQKDNNQPKQDDCSKCNKCVKKEEANKTGIDMDRYPELCILSTKRYVNERHKFETKHIPKCHKCKVSYRSSPLSIIMPCEHSVLCSNCAYNIFNEKYATCPKCFRAIEHIIIKQTT